MIWLVMIAAGLMNFAARFSMIGLIGNRPIPEPVRRLLFYTGPAVLSAIIAREVLVIDGAVSFSVGENARIIPFAVAALVAFMTRHVLATIASGMLVLWAIRYFS